MRDSCARIVGALGVLSTIIGCQHIAPAPLALSEIHRDLQQQDLSVTPIQAFATALARLDAADVAPFNAADGLSLQEGQAVALWYNPDLRVMRLGAERARATARASGLWLDPELVVSGGKKTLTSTEIEAVDPATGGTRDARTVERSWISIASLSITVPLSGRVQAEKRLFESEQGVTVLRAIEAEWETWTNAGIAWLEWSAAVHRVRLLDEQQALLERLAETAAALARIGELPTPTARLFSIELHRTDAERNRAVAIEHETRISLLHLLGLLPDAPVALVPTLERTLLASTGRPEDHPRIARLRAEYQAAEDLLRLELRKQYPDITVSPSYTDEQDETSIILGLGFPLPVWNVNQRGIADAAANRDVARARVVAGYHDLIAQSAQARIALEGSDAQCEQLLTMVAPAIDAQVEECLALLAIGELDIGVLYETVVQTSVVKHGVLDAMLERAIASYRLAAATVSGSILSVPATEDLP